MLCRTVPLDLYTPEESRCHDTVLTADQLKLLKKAKESYMTAFSFRHSRVLPIDTKLASLGWLNQYSFDSIDNYIRCVVISNLGNVPI